MVYSSANIINLNTVDVKSWIKNPNHTYIGRRSYSRGLKGSKWRNPFKIKPNFNRKDAVKFFERYIRKNKVLLKSLHELVDKKLGCYCAPELCHAEILHLLAGNVPVYQYHAVMESPKLPEATPRPIPHPRPIPVNVSTPSITDNSALDQKVTDALQGMSDILEGIGQDISNSLIPIPVNVTTANSILSIPTEETNKIYGTLLQSESTSSNSSVSSVSPPSNSPSSVNELDCKPRATNDERSKSLQFTSFSLPPCGNTERKNLPEGFRFTATDASSTLNPPSPFAYIPSPPSQPTSEDATSKILGFLANKVDLLAISINTLQFNLNKVVEKLQINMEVKVPETVQKVEQCVYGKFTYVEDKIDNYTKIVNKELNVLKNENAQLRDKLDSYILQESEREEQIKECFNNPQNVPNCITDLSPIKDELEKKLFDLDVRLIECEQYSRRESLVISGIPESISQNQYKLEEKVISILGLIGLNITRKDISACHQLYKSPGSRFPAKVVVRFVNRKIVNYCLEHRNDLQEMAFQNLHLNLRFYQSLCPKNEESLRICNRLSRDNKIHSHFIRNGFVKIVEAENGRPVKVKHPDHLREKFPDMAEIN